MSKYIIQLSDEQVKAIMEIYAPNHIEIEFTRHEKFINVTLRDCEGFEETYGIEDYTIHIYSWMGGERELLIKFRKKMLEWFGNEYAVNYLLTM